MTIQTGAELAAMCRKTAKEYRTLYVMGCFGAPLTGNNVERYCNHHEFNRQPERREMILAAANQDPPVFGFDCVCLIKGLLWGWDGSAGEIYGGAAYQSNGVPDIGTDRMFRECAEISDDFTDLAVGEAVWLPGHIGVYVGDGLAVECTTKWANCVQLTACNRDVPGYPRRDWEKHGKLPYVTYTAEKGEENMVLPVLRAGAQGAPVKALQALLIGYGYDFTQYGTDGFFGEVTGQALRDYQKRHGIDPDGICGVLTWRSLLGLE